MKHSVILLIGLIYAVSCQFYSDTCTYYSSNQDVYNGLNNYNGWINYTTTSGDMWFVNPCPGTVYDSPPCPEESSICLITSDSVSVRGLVNGSVFSDSIEGASQGIEIMEPSNEICPNGGTYKTIVEFICKSEDEHWTVVVEECVATLTIHSRNACPASPQIYDGPGFPRPSDDEEETIIVIPWGFLMIAVICFAVCLFCCCCNARRRRCQMAKKIQMEQFSNVAFQPIPASTQQTKASGSSLPSFNPYVAQPQYFYYYPTQQDANQPIVQLESMSVASSDEQMAKDLQAQFDREAVMRQV